MLLLTPPTNQVAHQPRDQQTEYNPKEHQHYFVHPLVIPLIVQHMSMQVPGGRPVQPASAFATMIQNTFIRMVAASALNIKMCAALAAAVVAPEIQRLTFRAPDLSGREVRDLIVR